MCFTGSLPAWRRVVRVSLVTRHDLLATAVFQVLTSGILYAIITFSTKARNVRKYFRRNLNSGRGPGHDPGSGLGARTRHSGRCFSFSRVPHKTALRLFISHSAADVKVEMNERCLLFQCKNQKLNLNLESSWFERDLWTNDFALTLIGIPLRSIIS